MEKEIVELTHEELLTIEGGIFSNLWEALGYLFTYHAREAMYATNGGNIATVVDK